MSRPRACAAVATASVCALVARRRGGSSTHVARCRGERDPSAPAEGRHAPARSAPARAQVNIVAWAGYAEDGTNDPTVDWVHPFEKATGCKVNVKVANTSDEMVS